MLQTVFDFILSWVAPVEIIFSILLGIPVVWTFIEVVWGRKRREKQWYKQVTEQPGSHPAILIADFLANKSIETTVKAFCKNNKHLAAIPESRIITVQHDARLSPEDTPTIIRKVREANASLVATGADTIHCFYGGPNVVAAILGAEMANGPRVLFYQHSSDGYHNYGPLRGEI